MFEKILLAVGGPDASMEPTRAAGRLAAALGSQVTIISVYRPTPASLGDPFYSETLVPRLHEAQRTLEEAAGLIRAEGGAEPELETMEGDPAERISTVARQRGFDLVVMGTHRRGRIGAALLGSVSGAVAARAGLPVMVVPERRGNETGS
jgi:nucleotide-binding universal stress UspA family protein